MTLVHDLNDNMDQEIINLFSNDVKSLQYFPTNTATEWSTILSKEISLDGYKTWTLHVNNFSVPDYVFNITSDMIEFKMIVKSRKSATKIIFSIEPGKYTSISRLISALNESIATSTMSPPNVAFDTDGNFVKCSNYSRSAIVLQFNSALGYVLGVSNRIDHLLVDYQLHSMNRHKSAQQFPYSSRINACVPRYFKIICNQVEPTLFGSTKEQILSFCPIESAKKGSNSLFVNFDQPIKYKIRSNVISQIDLCITPENSSDSLEIEEKHDNLSHISLVVTKYK